MEWVFKSIGFLVLLVFVLIIFKVNFKYNNKYLKIDIETTIKKDEED